VELRPAAEADVQAMVELQLDSWREGFVPILPDEFRLPDPDSFQPRLAEALRGPGVHSTLGFEGERLVGWVTYGANRDADAEPGEGELRSIFVHPGAWRSGVGSALLEHALAELARDGYQAATLWSFADNDRANRFYERHGFERDGAEQRREFSAGALEVRYRRAL
jgi:ribosomal protein S18 acetylase RimI-like enzyme